VEVSVWVLLLLLAQQQSNHALGVSKLEKLILAGVWPTKQQVIRFILITKQQLLTTGTATVTTLVPPPATAQHQQPRQNENNNYNIRSSVGHGNN
jgi:hypothetical protein